jgi:lipoate-protein ligase A
MPAWRLVDSGVIDPARSAAIDEAILTARNDGTVPNTLHLYQRSAATVSLGHFERISDCVDLSAAERYGVHLVRRMSGGSAIYSGPDQLTYSVVVDRTEVLESPQETFRRFCQGIINALGMLGLEAEFKPINDVLVGGRKISGSAQIRRHNVVLQHGTLLVQTDYQRMFAVLKSTKRDRGDMTSLAEELGKVPPTDVLKKALVDGFISALGIEIESGKLTREEENQADELVRTIYGSSEHTFLY